MNIANPCKVFVLASAFALSFGLRADGTLPIPGADSQTQFPLLMGGAATEARENEVSKLDISMSLDTSSGSVDDSSVLNACLENKILAVGAVRPIAYPAAGTVQVGDDLFTIKALCAPNAGDKRSVIATKTGRLLQLDGTFKVTAAKKLNFKGSALNIDTVTTSPESGEDTASVISFEMDQLPLDE